MQTIASHLCLHGINSFFSSLDPHAGKRLYVKVWCPKIFAKLLISGGEIIENFLHVIKFVRHKFFKKMQWYVG